MTSRSLHFSEVLKTVLDVLHFSSAKKNTPSCLRAKNKYIDAYHCRMTSLYIVCSRLRSRNKTAKRICTFRSFETFYFWYTRSELSLVAESALGPVEEHLRQCAAQASRYIRGTSENFYVSIWRLRIWEGQRTRC